MTSQHLPTLPSDWEVYWTTVDPIGHPDELTDHVPPRRQTVGLMVHRPRHRRVLVEFSWNGEAYVATTISSADPAGLSSADLTGLRIAALAAEAWYASALVPVAAGSKRPRSDLVTPDPRESTEPPPGGRGRPISDDRLCLAAQAWKQGKADRVNVKQAVADALHVSRPQASVYIKRARAAGLIPPVERKG